VSGSSTLVAHDTLLAGDERIADGNYEATLDLRLERADTVVFLDTPWWVCVARDEWELAGRVSLIRRAERERELRIMAEHGKHVALHVLRTKRAASELLNA
jgi:adenylate kinase family enzyme